MKKNFHYEDSQMVEKVAQWDCVVSIFGVFQDLTEEPERE